MGLFKEDLKSVTTVKMLQKCAPNIIIDREALVKMQLYVENCETEIGWLGTAIKEGNDIHITDVFLFDQEAHSTTTEITPEGLTKFAEAILQEENGMEIWNSLKVWGHSHVKMATSPSGQDDKQMETFAEGGHDWFIRIIANKLGSIRVDLYNYEIGIIYNNMQWEEGISEKEFSILQKIKNLRDKLFFEEEKLTNKHKDNVKKEIKEKVKRKTYASYTGGGYTNGGYRSGYWENNAYFGGSTPRQVNLAENNSYSAIGFITEDEEIERLFDQAVLLDLAETQTISDMNEIFACHGYIPEHYTYHEKQKIKDYAIRLANEIYYEVEESEAEDKENKGGK